ncbi:hypothetical protein Tco_1522857 [Tanacetum coccineum]
MVVLQKIHHRASNLITTDEFGDHYGFAPQLHESAAGLPKTKLVSHSCSLVGSTSAMEVSILIAFVLPGREHKCNESFKLGRPPALS